MDKAKAVNALAEALDLMRMMEDVLSPSNERAASSMPGVRITLRGARERMNAAYELFAREMVTGARTSTVTTSQSASRGEITSSNLEQGYRALVQRQTAELGSEEGAASVAINRKADLRSAVEKTS